MYVSIMFPSLFLGVLAQNVPSTITPVGTPLARPTDLNSIRISGKPDGAGVRLPEGFVSYSIEFSSFPDFAGNLSSPNVFSNNLLEGIGAFTGTKPYIRVGGNTQDYALYNSSLEVATNGTIVPSRSKDYPTILYIGPSYFESYQTWNATKFIHGFNLAKNSSEDRATLLEYVPLVCKALSHDNLLFWTLGNEPDLYKTSAQGIVRPSNWTEADYVNEWLTGVEQISDKIRSACPGLQSDKKAWYAPSFAGTSNSLKSVPTWQDGLNNNSNVAYIDSHNYIGGATQPGVTLAGTLMNHSQTVHSVAAHLTEMASLSKYGLQYILGETNSLYNEGAPGLSNSFGAALWGVDFNLYCAANNITRVHMHQGTNYRYASWQPIETVNATKGTKPPYYGNIAVAASLGDLTQSAVQVKNIALTKSTEAAYAIYADHVLKRITVINMEQYNYTGNEANFASRPLETYNFTLPTSCSGHGIVQRLIANGSDAITGITFNGMSYNYELNNGQPVLLGNVTRNEVTYVGEDGIVQVDVPHSSAALIQLDC